MFSNKAVGLDQGRPLQAIIPRIDELLADPGAYLAREEVRIPRDSVAWLWFVIPTILLVIIGWTVPRPPDLPRGAWLGVGCWGFITILTYAIMVYWAWPTRLEIVLTAQGVAIHHGREVVRAPWALFATAGSVIVSPVSFAIGKVLTIPVAPHALPQLELYRNGVLAARDRYVRTRVFRVSSDGEVQLTDWFAPNPTELGTLLLVLGNALTRPAPVAEAATDTAIQAGTSVHAITTSTALAPADARWQAVSIDRDGWLRVPLTRLVFPHLCCHCCRPTGDTRLRAVDAALPGLLAPLVLFYNDREKLQIQIPWCGTCFYRYGKRCWGGALYGALGGTLVGLGVANWFQLVPVFQFTLASLLGVVSLGLGYSLADHAPFEAKHYVDEQKIAFRFENPAFAHELMETVQKSVEA